MDITVRRTEETTWQKVKAMAAAGELKVLDAVTDTMKNGEKMVYEVAHITENEVLFVSKNLMEQRVPWNDVRNTTGGFKESSLCKYLNETVWNMLPEEMQQVISERECIQVVDGKEERYSLKLWLPSEYEVFEDDWASEAKEGELFEIFKNPANRVKLAGGDRANWWLCSVASGNSARACYVGNIGFANDGYCTNDFRVPVCFSIRIKE